MSADANHLTCYKRSRSHNLDALEVSTVFNRGEVGERMLSMVVLAAHRHAGHRAVSGTVEIWAAPT